MKKCRALLLVAGIGTGMVGSVHAESMTEELGQFEYVNSCAACHGPDGKGEGSIAGYLNAALPDLTQLQSGNNGVFPVSKVFKIIEGGPDIGPHGTQDMPAWGQRYVWRAEDDSDFFDNSASYAKFRILALIEYLSTIQEN